MKEKWSMSSSGITESLNIFISRFRCWGSRPQITEQPLMSLCPYLLSLLTACYLQLYIPPGDTKWMLRQCKGWKVQKLIKSVWGLGEWECNQKTWAGWDCWRTGRLLEEGSDAVWSEIWLIKSTSPLVSAFSLCMLRTWKVQSLSSRNLHANWVGNSTCLDQMDSDGKQIQDS